VAEASARSPARSLPRRSRRRTAAGSRGRRRCAVLVRSSTSITDGSAEDG
jgi:hypothetical protein